MLYINLLRREEAKHRVMVAQSVKKRRYAAVNQSIAAVVADYANRDYIDYLRGLAHNIELAV